MNYVLNKFFFAMIFLILSGIVQRCHSQSSVNLGVGAGYSTLRGKNAEFPTYKSSYRGNWTFGCSLIYFVNNSSKPRYAAELNYHYTRYGIYYEEHLMTSNSVTDANYQLHYFSINLPFYIKLNKAKTVNLLIGPYLSFLAYATGKGKNSTVSYTVDNNGMSVVNHHTAIINGKCTSDFIGTESGIIGGFSFQKIKIFNNSFSVEIRDKLGLTNIAHFGEEGVASNSIMISVIIPFHTFSKK